MARTSSPCTCENCQAHPRTKAATAHRQVGRVIAGLDEKQARRVAGLLATMGGHGGTTLLAHITGMSRTTILEGKRELTEAEAAPNRVRRPGGGRKALEKKDPRS